MTTRASGSGTEPAAGAGAVRDPHARDLDELVAELGVDPERGLDGAEVARRLAEVGPNELEERGGQGPWRILARQLASTLVWVLLAAAGVSAFLGDHADAVAILVIVVLNAALGFRQEYRAERAVAALRRLTVPEVKVRRDGAVTAVSARDLVPGDVVLLDAGDAVPADARLLDSANLKVQEAALTGESAAVDKDAGAEPVDAPLAERINMVHRGTVVTYGRGTAVVVHTGMATELGRIADLLQTVAREPTPLQQRLDRLGRLLALVALALVTVVFVAGVLRGEDLRLMLLTAVSLAVAAVPEGLPAVVTIALALGAQRMLERNALIRRLPAVETLGSVTVICTDKTGTITRNQMTVVEVEVAGQELHLGDGPTEAPSAAARALFVCGALCNDARGELGDRTEVALARAAADAGLAKDALDAAWPRVGEKPFDSERKRMATVHRADEARGDAADALAEVLGAKPDGIVCVKGAVESVLSVSERAWTGDGPVPLDDALRRRIVDAHDRLAAKGMRVLGLAVRAAEPSELDAGPEADVDPEHGLEFLGLTGIVDPPREQVPPAVAKCRAAGVRPVMITGDHPLTAAYIARQIGLVDAGEDGVVTGRELDAMTPEQLEETAERVSVYARVSPENKLRLIDALERQGHVVAMTGDGVNDGPALKKADIGVAMGITGTDVAKEASDMVLRDDDFATIVAAVEEGRKIYDNIRKFIKYLLSANASEVAVMAVGPLLGLPLPLLPLQILWMNLVTDGLPALALGLEPAERDVMSRPPHSPQEGILGRGLGRSVLWIGLFNALVALAVGWWYFEAGSQAWQTMVFTTLTLSQMSLALAVRSERDSLFAIGVGTNPPLLWAILSTFVLHLLVLYLPFTQGLFRIVPLSARDLLVALAFATLVFWAVEARKLWLRRVR